MYFSMIYPRNRHADSVRALAHEMIQYRDHQVIWQFFSRDQVQDREQKRDFLFRKSVRDGLLRFYTVSPEKPQAISEHWQVDSKEYQPRLDVGQQFVFELRANPVVTRLKEIKEPNNPGKTHIKVRHDVVMAAKKELLAAVGLKKEEKWSDWQADQYDQPLDRNLGLIEQLQDETSGKLRKPAMQALVEYTCSQWLIKRAEKAGFRMMTQDQYSNENLALSVNAYMPTREVFFKDEVDEKKQKTKQKRVINLTTVDFSGVLEVLDPAIFKKTLENGLGHGKGFGCGLLLIKPVSHVNMVGV